MNVLPPAMAKGFEDELRMIMSKVRVSTASHLLGRVPVSVPWWPSVSLVALTSTSRCAPRPDTTSRVWEQPATRP